MRLNRICAVALVTGLIATAPALAERTTVPLAEAASIAVTTTSANTDKAYQSLLEHEHQALLEALQAAAGTPLTHEGVKKARQSSTMADESWLKNSGYDFAIEDNQAAGIKILAPFTTLPREVLVRSQDTTTTINRGASAKTQEHALFDAEGISYLFFLSEALGPKLGEAFLQAYEKGEIAKAAALIKATEISTGKAKSTFNYPRPFLIDNNKIKLVKDEYIVKDGKPYSSSGGSYPSGHTNTGITDSLLLAEMVPERFTALVDRGAGYGYSRLVMGVHYPLDVMGSRMVVERNVAHYLADPAYHALFVEARDQLRAALEKECGEPLAACAKPAGAKSDPWSAPAQQKFYTFTMTYDLPRTGPKDVAMKVPEGAEILLESVRPELSAAERRELLRATAAPSGYALDSDDPQSGFWQRIDLYAAATKHPYH